MHVFFRFSPPYAVSDRNVPLRNILLFHNRPNTLLKIKYVPTGHISLLPENIDIFIPAVRLKLFRLLFS